MIDTHVHLMMDERPDAESVQGDSEATYAYRAAANLRNAAELLGLADTGLVEKGYRADLLVLPENPLEDVLAWQSPERVYVEGERMA